MGRSTTIFRLNCIISINFFIFNKQQVYKEDIADDMIEAIENLKLKTIIEINKLDTQPKNNPQPPKKYSE